MKLGTRVQLHRHLGAFCWEDYEMLLLQPQVHKIAEDTGSEAKPSEGSKVSKVFLGRLQRLKNPQEELGYNPSCSVEVL